MSTASTGPDDAAPIGYEDEPQRRGVGLATAVAALGGFLFGYDTGVIGGALPYIKDDFGLDDNGQQFVVSILLAGALIGALTGGTVADRFGRRPTLTAAAGIFALGGVLAGLAPGTPTLAAARFVLGLTIGVSSVCVPLYIAELAPKERRGGLVSMNQFMITVGIFVSYLVGFAFSPIHGWRWMLALAAVPAALMFVGMLRAQESPRWLINQGRPQEAREVLLGSRSVEEAEQEVYEIQEAAKEESRWGWADLRRPRLRPALVLGIGVAAVNQLSGVNAVIYYAPTILEDIFGDAGALLSTVGIGLVNMIVTWIALRQIDRLGRRPLLLGGTAAVLGALVALTVLYLLPSRDGIVGYLVVAALCVYIAAFAASLGLAIWLVNSEVYPTPIRGKAASLGSATHWGLDMVIAFTVLTLISTVTEAGLFALYGLFALAGLIFLWKRMPETKGRSLEEIDADLQASAGRAR